MWELDCKESWAPKNWCFWTVVLEKVLEIPLDIKEIQPVHPKGTQSWIFTGRTDAEAETPILWPPDEKNWLIWMTLMLWKTDGGRRRGWQRMRGRIASPTQWRWLWVIPGSWWRTGRPGVLQSMGSRRNTTEQLYWARVLNPNLLGNYCNRQYEECWNTCAGKKWTMKATNLHHPQHSDRQNR